MSNRVSPYEDNNSENVQDLEIGTENNIENVQDLDLEIYTENNIEKLTVNTISNESCAFCLGEYNYIVDIMFLYNETICHENGTKTGT